MKRALYCCSLLVDAASFLRPTPSSSFSFPPPLPLALRSRFLALPGPMLSTPTFFDTASRKLGLHLLDELIRHSISFSCIKRLYKGRQIFTSFLEVSLSVIHFAFGL